MSRWPPWAAGATALAATMAVVHGWVSTSTDAIDVAWLPSLGSRLVLRLDPLATPIAVFVLALAVIVFVYTAGYLPAHLRRVGHGRGQSWRFCGLMAGFAASMVLLVVAQDLVIIFLALELGALASYLLIGFDAHREPARRAAAIALLVTVGSSLLFAVGIVLVAARMGTTVLSDLIAAPEGIGPAAATCLALGVLGKSAQVPLHFWLPRAMVAPTPVSAYLHSAALVAAGVYVLARTRVLLEPTPTLLHALVAVGLLSIAVGAAMALASDEIKRILAYSTIAQYGYAVVMVAVGGTDGAVGVALFLVAHGLCKSALFLTAGAVHTVEGVERISDCGGLGRRMPVVAAASLVAAAGLAGAPLTIGYWKDDLFLGAALHRSAWLGILATLAIAATWAYAGRFWLGVFAGGSPSGPARRTSWLLAGPIVVLAIAILIGGVWTGALSAAFDPAGSVVAGAPVHADLSLVPKTDLRAALTAIGTAAGVIAIATTSRWQPWAARTVGRLARSVGPQRMALGFARLAGALSARLHELELRDLRERIAAVVWPTTVLTSIGLLARGVPRLDSFALEPQEIPTAASLLLCAFAAIATVRRAHHVTRVVLVSFVGYGLALTFALLGATDVALVVALVETTLTILLLSFLWHLTPDELERGEEADREPAGRFRAWAGVAAGAIVACLATFTLGKPGDQTVAHAQARLSETAHAGSPVAAVLADFRGLDTVVELTVFAVAILGARAIARGRR